VKFFVVEPAPVDSNAGATGLFTARYQLPPGQRSYVCGERVAVVDDVISAGSSVRAGIAALTDRGRLARSGRRATRAGGQGAHHFAAQDTPVEMLGIERFPLWASTSVYCVAPGRPVEIPGVAKRES